MFGALWAPADCATLRDSLVAEYRSYIGATPVYA
jgi:hypothetical protein